MYESMKQENNIDIEQKFLHKKILNTKMCSMEI